LAPDTQLEQFSLHIHLSEEGYDHSEGEVFSCLAGIGTKNVRGGWLRPDGNSGDLHIFTPNSGRFLSLDDSLDYSEVPYAELTRQRAMNLIPFGEEIGADSASVYYLDEEGTKWRLPWGTEEYNKWYASVPQRNIREVATERSLLNAGGIFYELPREISGGIRKIKPVSTHNKMIFDFCSWRGMMVISGTKPEVKAGNHFFSDPDKDAGLWLGTIDDLWSFGKPTGSGGPWLNSVVIAGELSDPYLMLGFDEKELVLTHDSNEPVSFELLADFTGDGEFILVEEVQVKSGENKTFNFPDGFSANWVRLKSNLDCTASGTFYYQ